MQKFSTLLNVTQSYVDETLSLYIILDYSLSFSLLAKQVEKHKREKKMFSFYCLWKISELLPTN